MPLLIEAREADTQTQHPKLSGAYLALAVKLQEAASDMTSSTVGQKLSAAIQAAHKGTGKYAYYLDHAGDDSDGDVYYSCSGDTMTCPYEMTDNGDGVAATAKLDMDSARKVSPRVTYEDVPDDEDDDGMATMYESWKRDKIYAGEIPLFERFVSKAERDQMDEGDFAGKGKSFPINKPGDIMAAVRSIGRAGSGNYGPAALKANIIRIAKKKGWTKYLPKAWQGDGDSKKESHRYLAKDGMIRVTEATAFEQDIVSIREASSGATKLVKLITPGKGASAYYTAEMLKRDGPKVFIAGTPMRIDHPTQAEEAARPEGSVKDWGAVLAEPARWMESYVSPSTGKDNGPGLYAPIKPFSDHAQTIDEKGPWAGVSIAAWGEPMKENGRIVMRDGVPLLASLKRADGVDMVTRAGAGGLFVSEAARAANQTQEASMDADELKLLRESVAQLSKKETRREAIQEGARILRDVDLPDAAKEYVIETVLKESLPIKDGTLDLVKFKESIDAETKRFGAAIGAGSRVTGMGTGAVVEITEAQRAAQAERDKADEAMYRESWATLLGEQPDEKGNFRIAEVAFRGRTA